jgi:hypothetical protein
VVECLRCWKNASKEIMVSDRSILKLANHPFRYAATKYTNQKCNKQKKAQADKGKEALATLANLEPVKEDEQPPAKARKSSKKTPQVPSVARPQVTPTTSFPATPLAQSAQPLFSNDQPSLLSTSPQLRKQRQDALAASLRGPPPVEQPLAGNPQIVWYNDENGQPHEIDPALLRVVAAAGVAPKTIMDVHRVIKPVDGRVLNLGPYPGHGMQPVRGNPGLLGPLHSQVQRPSAPPHYQPFGPAPVLGKDGTKLIPGFAPANRFAGHNNLPGSGATKAEGQTHTGGEAQGLVSPRSPLNRKRALDDANRFANNADNKRPRPSEGNE